MRLKKINMVISCCLECPYLKMEDDDNPCDSPLYYCSHKNCSDYIKKIDAIYKHCPLEDMNMPVGFTQLDHDKD